MVQSQRLVGVGIVSLRQEDKVRSEFWFAVECLDAFQNIAKEHLECLAVDYDFLASKTRT